VEHLLAFAVRATATYVFLLILLRISGKRTVGEGTPFDVVVALVIGDFPDDMIWGEVPLAQGFVAMGTVMVIHLCVVYASFHSLWFDRLVGSGPAVLVRDGRLRGRALRAGRMNDGDLDVVLRHHGGVPLHEVEEAALEPTGEVSLRRVRGARPATQRDVSPGRAA
jgi:uncharacterized membrane protein YcaP (DUF421 family)